MTLEEIKQRLTDRKLSVVAERIGISTRALEKIAAGKTSRPHQSTLRLLSHYLGVGE